MVGYASYADFLSCCSIGKNYEDMFSPILIRRFAWKKTPSAIRKLKLRVENQTQVRAVKNKILTPKMFDCTKKIRSDRFFTAKYTELPPPQKKS